MLRLGLIGYPLTQSLSPRLHAAALQSMELEGEYRLYPVPPPPEGVDILRRFTHHVRTGELDGLNVTLPHKQAIIRFLDELTPTAQAIGAVNMVYREAEKAIGDNTDAPGFLIDLESKLKSAAGSPMSINSGDNSPAALVMGAGGAARAVVYALWKSGWTVYLAARRLVQAQELVEHFKRLPEMPTHGKSIALRLDPFSLKKNLSDFEDHGLKIIVNATPVGMIPDVESCPWPDEIDFPRSVLVYDLITKPPETRLVQRARQAGLDTANGHGMLVEQAALSLERWTGLPVPRQVMYRAVVDFLAGQDFSPANV